MKPVLESKDDRQTYYEYCYAAAHGPKVAFSLVCVGNALKVHPKVRREE